VDPNLASPKTSFHIRSGTPLRCSSNNVCMRRRDFQTLNNRWMRLSLMRGTPILASCATPSKSIVLFESFAIVWGVGFFLDDGVTLWTDRLSGKNRLGLWACGLLVHT
jgi:hypothetical protein